MMFELIDTIQAWVPKFMLIAARLSGLLAAMPIFSYPVINVRVRTAMTIMLAVIIFPMTGDWQPPAELISLFVVIMKEVVLGLIIGFGGRVIFEALIMAGSFISRQMGLAMANVMDPTSRQQLPVISQFWFLLLIMTMFVTDGHYLIIETMVRNFQLLPLGTGFFSPESGETMVHTGTQAFNMSLRLAAPAMVFLLLVDTAIAFTARVMPQMNIFMVTLPLKIGMGMFIIMFSIDIFQLLFDMVIDDVGQYFVTIIANLQGS